MKYVEKILQKLEDFIRNGNYDEIETESVELKNLPPNQKDKEYKSIKESMCAFLNTNDGIIIIGIKQDTKNKKYILKGYKGDFEPSIKLLKKHAVTDIDGNDVEIPELRFEVKDFMDENVLIVYVEKLPHDKKFVFFNGVAYERIITGDHEIERNKILAQEEYKEEIQYAKELHPVINAEISDLSVDKLNDYIYQLNKEIKIESAKADIENAQSFLLRKSFITKDNQPTTLGMLGECINNSLAHRDYTINRFVNIDIVPQKHIEIRNPGGFKKSLLLEAPEDEIPLRRIVPNQKLVNPKLADILKVFNKYEGKGIGMATLVNECLKDKIDLPYYRFNSETDISLFIRSGKLFDDTVENLLNTFSGYIDNLTDGNPLTDEQKHVIAYLYKSEIENEKYHYTILLTPDNNHLEAIKSLEKLKLIYKHEKSTSIRPVFILDRNFMKTNFNKELSDIFGKSYRVLSPDYKDCLCIMYKMNTYSNKKLVSASRAGNHLYIEKYNKITDVKSYDNFRRKIRYVFNKLEKGKFIKKQDKMYLINSDYHKDLFD